MADKRVTIAVPNFDLMAALQGRTMGVRGDDGETYDLRLMTADEACAAMDKSQAEHGVDPPPEGNRHHAERLTARIPATGAPTDG